jgi:hypothetical protein
MRNTLFVLTLTLSFCHSEQTYPKATEGPSNATSECANLVSLYPEILSDTLDVYASDDSENQQFAYHGKKLDSTAVYCIDKSASFDALTQGYFACGRFKINDSLVGLVTRIPSYYSSTAIKVFVFNRVTNESIKTIDVADIFGDAGDASKYSTRIVVSDKPIFITYSWSSYNHSVEDENDTIIENYNSFIWTQLINDRLDTISKDSATIVSKFPQAIRRLARY